MQYFAALIFFALIMKALAPKSDPVFEAEMDMRKHTFTIIAVVMLVCIWFFHDTIGVMPIFIFFAIIFVLVFKFWYDD